MRLIVQPVARSWLDTIRSLGSANFVNLWSVSPNRKWREGQPGDILLFVHEAAPTKILGFGILHSRMPDLASRAWHRFGPRNGVASLSSMRMQIADYRPLSRHEDPLIADLIVASPVLFPEQAPLEIEEREVHAILGQNVDANAIAAHVSALRMSASRMAAVAERPRPEMGDANASMPTYEQELLDLVEANVWSAYGRRCAVTGWRVRCTLQIVFIRPLDQGGTPDASNAVLLRKDLAALHIDDLIAFNEDAKLVVSTALALMDAEVYGELGRRRLRRALLASQMLDPDSVQWRLARFHRRQASPDWDMAR